MYHYVPGQSWVCTLYVLCTVMHWYILEKTKKMIVQEQQDIWIRTVDLMHSILHAIQPIPLQYQRAFHGDIYG
jgi:hypothetical protein